MQHFFLILLALSFGVAALLTAMVKRLGIRYALLDHHPERKPRGRPIPLMGGVAVVVAFYGIVLIHMAVLALLRPDTLREWLAPLHTALGNGHTWKIIGVLLSGLLVFAVGLVDDLRVLRPGGKLIGQILATAVLVACGVRLELFDLPLWISLPATFFWIILVTNSMNLLDNMDGLCGGVSIIAAFTFMLCLRAPIGVGNAPLLMLLVIFAGVMGGFLIFNRPPAKIFLGDAGALFSGFFLATISVVGTFHVVGTGSRMTVIAPLLALSVPLFDTFSVIYIRWQNGIPIWKGDKRHFSHRLVDLGMTPSQAVVFIYMVALVVGLGGALLPSLTQASSLFVLIQSLGVFLLIVMLMHVRKK